MRDGRSLPPWYRHFKHAYAITPHRSQGKTADAVIVSADQMDGDLFYVAATRGREQVRILTSDIKSLRQSVMQDGDRQSASELADEADNSQGKKQRRYRERRAAREGQEKLFKHRGKERDRSRPTSQAMSSRQGDLSPVQQR